MNKKIRIEDVKKVNIFDLCFVCVPKEKREDEDFKRGIEEKRLWCIEMLEKYGSFAKIAYVNDEPVGMIQYRPFIDENVVNIDCIYVPDKKYWNKGIGKMLLNKLIEEMGKPHRWFNKKPDALIAFTFPGHKEGQISASEFFRKCGFRMIDDNPNHLYFALKEGYSYKMMARTLPEYKPSEDDKGKVLIFCGPNFCPVAFPVFLKPMEKYIREVDQKIPVYFVDISKEKDISEKRNAKYGDCVVNGRLIKTFVFDKSGFQNEAREALEK